MQEETGGGAPAEQDDGKAASQKGKNKAKGGGRDAEKSVGESKKRNQPQQQEQPPSTPLKDDGEGRPRKDKKRKRASSTAAGEEDGSDGSRNAVASCWVNTASQILLKVQVRCLFVLWRLSPTMVPSQHSTHQVPDARLKAGKLFKRLKGRESGDGPATDVGGLPATKKLMLKHIQKGRAAAAVLKGRLAIEGEHVVFLALA